MSASGEYSKRACTGLIKLGLMASTVLAATPVAIAQDQPAAAGSGAPIEEIIVTAQKRAENLQSVPVSVQAFSGKKLDQLNATEFNDYVKYMPSVVFQTIAPSQTNIYMRGISMAGGQDGNHSGPLPLVGVYLDEQPVTSILGNIDIHMYDISRIEALAGPQGTLFGASSEAGTIRIITNKPDPSKFSASYDLQLDTTHGDIGNIVEGYVNVPISDRVAIRLVGFEEGDPGYINNTSAIRTYEGTNIVMDNAAMAGNNINGVQTYGGRGALGVNLDDEWTATAQIMGQDQRSTGVFGFNPSVGDLQVTRFYPDNTHDHWAQAALTIQGKIGDLDFTYSGGYFDRGLETQDDYSDYTVAYTASYGPSFPKLFVNAAGQQVNPSQRIIGRDHFTKITQEARVASPSDDRFRFVAGLFFERQEHKISQDYIVDGLSPGLSITGWPSTLWLTQEMRVDRDLAAFGQATYDITDQLSITGGVRVFESRNSLYGFFGFGKNNIYGSSTGQNACFLPGYFEDAPCSNLDKSVEEVNTTFKANVEYKIDPDKMIYATVSSGFRPGGVNRVGTNGEPPPVYTSDMLYNYEIGWKTTWDSGQFRWNGAFFWENWDNFQFAFLGPNSVTKIANAGAATVRGMENDLTWVIDPNWTLSGAASFINSELTAPVCPNNGPGTVPCPPTPYWTTSGTPLPVTAPVKFNATLRYESDLSDSVSGFVQGSTVFEGHRTSDLRANATPAIPVSPRDQIGPMPAYASFDFSIGIKKDEMTASFFVKNAFDSRGEIYRYVECGANCLLHPNVYVVPILPQTFGIKFGQKF